MDRQLVIIANKADEDALNRYGALLSAAVISTEVKECLKTAYYMKHKEFNRLDPMVVPCDSDDFNEG